VFFVIDRRNFWHVFPPWLFALFHVAALTQAHDGQAVGKLIGQKLASCMKFFYKFQQ
jgi:hypothetical protein